MGGTITTWAESFEIPYGEDTASRQTSDLFADWDAATNPSVKITPEPVSIASESICVEPALPPSDVACKLRLNETVALLNRVLGASEEDPDLTALSAALKTKLGASDLKKPPPTLSSPLDLLSMRTMITTLKDRGKEETEDNM